MSLQSKIIITSWLGLALLAPTAWANEAKPAKAAEKSERAEKGDKESAAGDESLSSLRQRLAERLSTREASAKGREEAPRKAKAEGKSEAKSDAKPDAKGGHHDLHWAYAGEGGPDRWGELKPEFKQCALGSRQSPIDIRDGIRVDLEKIRFEYQPSNFSVLDNGHTVQVNVAPGNALQVMGRRFELLQFHFHRPSEERVNGRQFDMVAHLVHKDADGKLGVVAVLLERGRDQPLIQTIWNNLPLEKGEALPAPGTIDLNQLLPEDRAYYTYMGSLTTPPCSEGVLWMVMRQPVQLSNAQIAIFSKLYPMNARPIQPSSGRLIKESN
ncbi:carbonic anhydrase family protein [Paucibacter sp. APW11]|uniref:carbonic anhydrase n=1 Tax=Roseateles aquae TaxID=3077235 RepID=A0ABU3PCF6_9BURK|nr:carbonic anhydrase family protein [Paucibacter sp. APW11]MDT9000257.1 carbonic anhydrase family protein [Paucibacter sp. APW11]